MAEAQARMINPGRPGGCRFPGDVGPGLERGGETERVVVFTVSVDVAAPEPLGVTDDEEKEQVTPWGKALEQLSVTAWLKPLTGLTATV